MRALRKLRYRARCTFPSRMMHDDEDVANSKGAIIKNPSPDRPTKAVSRDDRKAPNVARISDYYDTGDARRTMLYRGWQAERSEMARKLALAAAEDLATRLASSIDIQNQVRKEFESFAAQGHITPDRWQIMTWQLFCSAAKSGRLEALIGTTPRPWCSLTNAILAALNQICRRRLSRQSKPLH